MELQNLTVRVREVTGKGPARQARLGGDVPAILYGGAGDPLKLTVNSRELNHLLHGKQGEHAVLQLTVEDQPELSGPALVKAVQHHPVRGDVLHADLFRIDLKKRIETVVPVQLVGQSKGVVEGGVLDHQCREVDVECLPTEVPEFLPLDVTGLEIGDGFHVSDIPVPQNVTILTPGNRAVVAVHAPRVVTEAVAEEVAEGEVPEGEEAAEADKDEAAKSEDSGEE